MGFSIRTLLLVVAVASVAAAAILRHSSVWASVMVTLHLGFCIVGALMVWLRPDRRLFWAPFCLVAWPFFFLALVDSRFTRISTELITTRLIYEIWFHNHYDDTVAIAKDVGFVDFPKKTKEEVYYMILTESTRDPGDCVFWVYATQFRIFYFTLQSVFGLVFSTAAGWIASAWFRPPTAVVGG